MSVTPKSWGSRAGGVSVRLGWVVDTMVALALVAFCVGGCNGSSNNSYTSTSASSQHTMNATSPAPNTQATAQNSGNPTPQPGQTNTSTLSATTTGGKRDAVATYIWTPPFDFIQAYRFPGRPPDNPSGPPPFVFSNVPLVSGTGFEPVQVEFDWPPLPSGVTSLRGVETFRVRVAGEQGEPNPVHFFYTLTAAPKAGSPREAERYLAPVVPADPANYDYLEYTRWIDGLSQMIPSLCDKYVEGFNSGDFFYAIRMPAVAAPGSPGAYTLPYASPGGDLRSRAVLQNWSALPATGFDATLVRAPEYLTCLENSLPEAEGMHWLALAAEAPVLDNCATFPLTEQWSIMLILYLQREILDRELLTYACYRGDNPLLKAACAWAAEDLGFELREKNDAECCLTCLGPIPMQVTQSYNQMELHNANVDLYVQPHGQRKAFLHYLTSAPAAAALAYTHVGAQHGLQWGFYKDVNGHYDLSQPITQANPGFTAFWIVSEPITAAIPKGEYIMKITATTAKGAEVWTNDFIIVGELWGDLNQDQLLDAVDLVLLANVLAENIRLEAGILARADLDYNQRLGVPDLTLLQRKITE